MPRVRKVKKVTDDEPRDNVLLPPCLVCEGRASGLHFGVNTCEACKAFFRRCLNRDKDTPLTCAAEKNCIIFFQNKVLCPYCRFQKCLQVGMSKEAIKTGRYTLDHKASLKKQAETRHVENGNSNPEQPEQSDIMASSEARLASPQHQEKYTSSLLNAGNQLTHSSQLELEWNQNVAELEEITDTLVRAFKVFTPYTEEIRARIHKEQSEYQNQKDLIEELFGPMQPLTREEYLEIYKTTGIDIDGRMEKARTVVPTIKKSIISMVKFARYIPGLTEMSIADQIVLMEGCGFEWWVINASNGVNVEGGLFTSFFGITQTKAEMTANHLPCSASTVDLFFRMAAILQDIQTDTTTDALLAAICITNPDNRKISNPKQMEDIQYRLIEALSHHLAGTKRHSLKVLHKLLDVSKEMRTLKKFDVLGRTESGEHITAMGQHMGPIIHALICERPPACKQCNIEPCAKHQQYLPENLPTYRAPPVLKSSKKGKNLLQLAMDWHLEKAICPDVDCSDEMMALSGELGPRPLDYSTPKCPGTVAPCIMPCSVGNTSTLDGESTNMPIDYSTCNLKADSTSCCQSICNSTVTMSLANDLQASGGCDAGSGESMDASVVEEGMSSGVLSQGGTFDKWQALQKVCQHFMDEYESPESAHHCQSDTEDSLQMEVVEGRQTISRNALENVVSTADNRPEQTMKERATVLDISQNVVGKGATAQTWSAPGPSHVPSSGGKNIEALSYRQIVPD